MYAGWSITFLLLVIGLLLINSQAVNSAPTRDRRPLGFKSVDHVVIFGTDGLGGVYLENATSFLPNINRFFVEGSTTTYARNKRHCKSSPNWGAVITGMGPQESGILNNSWVPPVNGTLPDVSPISGAGKIPETMWRVAKTEDSSMMIAVVVSWEWIQYLVEEDVVDYNYWCMLQDFKCVPKIEKCPNLMFIHFDGIDQAGHNYTWGSQEYYDAVKIVDGYVGEIMNTFVEEDIFDQTLFILVADHGGYGLNHENFDEICIRIPILMMGPQVKQGYTMKEYTTNTDIAPTVLNALGLQPGKYMIGKVLEEAYEF